MNRWRLALASARHHARAHFLVFLGVVIGAAVLTGAGLGGDRGRAPGARSARARIGEVDLALVGGERFFRSGLAARLARAPGLEKVASSALVVSRGSLSSSGGRARLGRAFVLGVDESFFALAPRDDAQAPVQRAHRTPEPGHAAINARVAEALGITVGETLLIRVERPGELPRDATLASSDDVAGVLRLEVAAVFGPEDFGDFALTAAHVAEPNVFVARDELQQALGMEGRANLLLLGAGGRVPNLLEPATAALDRAWSLADAGLAPREPAPRGAFELGSQRVLMEPAVGDALARTGVRAVGALTWFVNSIEHGERVVPYSTVAGLGVLDEAGSEAPEWLTPVPADLGADEIVLNDWLASDLEAQAGDEVLLRYYTLGAGRQLQEASRSLRVRSIVPLEGAAADPSWMPDFPGLADSEHCRDWEPGIPVELDRLRERDEEYWREHRGTPKAFVALETARSMWATPLGDLTSVRVEPSRAGDLTTALRRELDPGRVGLWLRDVRAPSATGSAPTTDFGSLFVGLSSFLLAGAFLLTALFFALGVEERGRELGTLLALGFTRRRVRRMLLREALVVAVAGIAIGVPAGVGYTALVLRGLDSIWSDAVGAAGIELSVGPTTLVIGGAATLIAAGGSILLAFRRLTRLSILRLLSGLLEPAPDRPTSLGHTRRVAIGALGVALVSVGLGWSGAAAAGAFFGAGAAALVAALAGLRLWLARSAAPAPERETRLVLSRGSLARSGAARRPGRSLATAATLASGVFLVVSIGVHRQSPERAGERSSGTGGFAFHVETTLPLLHDLGTPRGRDAVGIDEEEWADVTVVPLRVREGDDASCLNLARPSAPRLVGVPAGELVTRGAFTFAATLGDAPGESPWSLLEQAPADADADVVPGIADAASVTWSMHRALGDDIVYRDERGEPFAVRIVGTLAGSMLQGDLLIPERDFAERFPLAGGHRALLVDAAPVRAHEVAQTLDRALGDLGAVVQPAGERLAQFQAVQNTYLSIFQGLGALGLLLGSAGLGVIVLRNANERRGEFAALRAVGWSRASLFRLVLREHLWILFPAVLAGLVAAAVALVPASRAQGTGAGGPAWGWALGFAGLLIVLGGLSLVVAVRWATRGDPLRVLARE